MKYIARPFESFSDEQLLNSKLIDVPISNIYIEAELRGLVPSYERAVSKHDISMALHDFIRLCRYNVAFWDKIGKQNLVELGIDELEKAENALKALHGTLMLLSN